MSDLVLTNNGMVRRVQDVELADKISELKKKKDPWTVIEALTKAWVEKSPDEAEAVKIDVEDNRSILADAKFGQTKGGKDFERRFTIIFPTNLMLLIRSQFNAEELPFDRAFYQEFAKRFPLFKVAQQL